MAGCSFSTDALVAASAQDWERSIFAGIIPILIFFVILALLAIAAIFFYRRSQRKEKKEEKRSFWPKEREK